MGLDGIEMLMAIEESFQIAIPDEDAERIISPGDLRDYLVKRLSRGEIGTECLEQRAFYRLRAALQVSLQVERGHVKPATRWVDIFPPKQLRKSWATLRRSARAESLPSLTLVGRIPSSVETVGLAASLLARRSPAALLDPGEGWPPEKISAIVKEVIREQLGIDEFGWEQHFVRDLGVG